MLIRVAKPGDEARLAALHYLCSADQPGGIMYKLGIPFLRRYYRIFLREKYSVVLCVENDGGMLIGIASGSMKEEEHVAALKRHRFGLALASIPAIIRAPRLLGEILSRQKFKNAECEDGGYIVLQGPREEYWGWHPEYRDTGGALELHRTWLAVVAKLGISHVKLELDAVNTKAAVIQKFLGARVIREIVTPDEKHRLILQFDL